MVIGGMANQVEEQYGLKRLTDMAELADACEIRLEVRAVIFEDDDEFDDTEIDGLPGEGDVEDR